MNDEQPRSPFVEGLGLVDLVDRWHLHRDEGEHLYERMLREVTWRARDTTDTWDTRGTLKSNKRRVSTRQRDSFGEHLLVHLWVRRILASLVDRVDLVVHFLLVDPVDLNTQS